MPDYIGPNSTVMVHTGRERAVHNHAWDNTEPHHTKGDRIDQYWRILNRDNTQ